MNSRPELTAWKEIRKAYPGWLILPECNRSDLLAKIEFSPHDGLAKTLLRDQVRDWDTEDLLDAWSELNWQLERALYPLRPEWARQIESILAKIVPSPELAKTQPGFFVPEAKRLYYRSDLRQAWIDLAIAVLRHHRELRQATDFFAWLERLAPLEMDWDIIHHQRSYQAALWHLTFMDDAAAMKQIDAWNANRGCDPYWLARKAGLLAEIGQIGNARDFWRDAIRRLQGERSDGIPFYASSRESAIQSVFLQLPRGDKDWKEINDRVRFLSSLDGIVPWDTLARLTYPDLDYREKLDELEENPQTHYSFSELWHPRAAIQCFRLCEELGFPLVAYDGFRTVLRTTKALKDSLADLALACGELGGTSLLRLRNVGLWKKLDGAQVAVIPEPLWTDLKTACENAWRQIEQSTNPMSGDDSIYRACGLLRIIQWRIEGGERRDWVCRLLGFAEKAPASRQFANARALTELLPDLTTGLLPNQVSNILEQILAFPLPEEVGVELRFWPSPFQSLRVADSSATLSKSALQRINRLIDMVPSSKEAIIRLVWLAGSGLLPDDVCPRLATNLWGESDQLPIVYPAYPSVLLQLPEPRPGLAKEALKRRFLTGPMPNLRNDKGAISFGGPDWCSDLHRISRPYRWKDRPFVDWTHDEAETLLAQIQDWWDREGRALLTSDRPFTDLAYHARFYHLNFCLARAIGPALAIDSDAGCKRLPRLLDELERAGRTILSVLPLLLRYRAIDVDEVESRLIDGVGSTDETNATEAIWGIIHWTEFREVAGLPEVPPRLIERLVMFLATRASDKLITDLVGTIEAILAHQPDILTERAKELLELALDALQVRAAYPKTWHQRDRRSRVDIVELRRNAVQLASAVASARISDHDAIRDWLNIGRTDPLSVVRHALKNMDDQAQS